MAVLSTSYDVESAVRTTLKNTISPTATTGIQINYVLTITQGVLRFDPDTDREEFISFGGVTVSGGVTTLTDVVRDLNLTGDTFTGSGTGSQHSGGSCVVELCNFHSLYNLKANKDRINTFTADQYIDNTHKLFFYNANSWIYGDLNDIYFRSPSQSQVSLSTLASAAGTDEKVKVSAGDTTNGLLNNKMSAGDGIIFSITNPGANEILDIDIDLHATPGLEFNGGALRVKTKANGGILIDANGVYWDESEDYSPTGIWDWSGATMSNMEARRLVDTAVFGEVISVDQAVTIYGDTRMYKAQSDVLIDHYGFVGTAEEVGILNDTKKVNFMGPIIDISGIVATSGKLWAGEAQAAAGSSIPVYGNGRYGQTITIPALQTRIDRIDLTLTKVLAPGGNYTCAIYATAGGVPTGGALASVNLATASMASGVNSWTGFNLVVVPAVVYAIVLYNAAADVNNHYTWSFNNANPYAGGTRVDSADAGANWATSPANDFVFSIYYNAVAGTDLFLTNAEGVIGAVPGTYFQRVARAISDTKAVMSVGSPSIFATYNFNSAATTVDTTITLGFRAKALVVYMSGGDSYSTGIWHHGASGSGGYYYAGQEANSEAADAGAGKIARINGPPAANNWDCTLAIVSVTADSITIRKTENSASLGGITVNMIIFG